MSTSATASTVGGSSSDINSRRLSSSTKRASSSTSQLNVSSSIGSLAGGSGSSGAGQYSNSSLDYSESSTLTYPGGLLMGSRGSPLGQTLGGSSVGPPSTPSTPSVSGSSSLTRPRYTKKPLRGPYGEMLEKEIRKSSMSEKQRSLYADLAFLNDLLEANKRRSKDSTSDFGGSNFKGSDSEISSERKSGLSNCSSLDDSTKRTSDIMVSEISDFETNPSPGRVSTPSIDLIHKTI
uniref:Uncharacterized protein n=1 Tax=Tetranychus urticae TaxID=32264 RepID=T1KR10_TETUR